ncbi:rhomboid family intramembrane serine protease [Mesorhizobium sp. L-8-10]|uniref:rhomboid family intramembrane serine protease n=1 Tax=Mesorhizobium sp. L-8-10 TaxID=2744523 RepID=UPI0019256303|nr:rhomboid family intramembrane serine protease [Mesorhizobium sp. L-8-10]BCH32462.1 rhomboid family intramembrane serine protease [Mesorhizobium sp. L-8-10]
MNQETEHPSGFTGNAPREPVFNMPGIIVLLIATCTAVFLVQTYVLTDRQYFELLVRGAFIPIRYSGRYALEVYAFTSPVTYAFLHGSFAHLAVNMIWLAAFGTPLANRLGNPSFLLFWIVTGFAAVGLHYVLHPLDQAPLVGASGAISGMMGAAARFGFRASRATGRSSFDGPLLPIADVFRSRTVVTFLAVWMVMNLATGLIGFAPGVDDRIAWEAHIGGFAAGFFGIGFFVGAGRRF